MRQTARRWRLHSQTSVKLADLAQQCNPTLRGWWNYYGTYYRKAVGVLVHHIDEKLEHWARRKYKRLAGRYRASAEWLSKMRQVFPQLFVHWRNEGYRVG